MKKDLYETITNFIDEYYDDPEHCDFLDKMEKCALKLYPGKKCYIYDYDTENDTYELDKQLDDLLKIGQTHKIIDFCNVWDDESIITVIITEK